MHPQPFLMFKSNPFKEEFQRYDGKSIRTLHIQNFSFFDPPQIQSRNNHNKIYLERPKLTKTSKSPKFNPLKSISMEKDNCERLNKKALPQRKQDRPKKSFGETVQSPKIIPYDKLKKTKLSDSNQQKKFKRHQEHRITDSLFSARKQKIDSLRETGFSSFQSRTINHTNETVGQQRKLKQKLYHSIDFDNLFSKIQSQVTHFNEIRSPQNSPEIKDKLILLDKMKRYSKTPTSKARTVFDQFNLKYLINKRKNFNIKHESDIKGSHLPYFQSFNLNEVKNSSRYEKRQELTTSAEKFVDKLKRKSPDLPPNQQGESRRKKSSFIVIDDHGIVHEQNPECNTKDRDDMIQKISSKMISMRKMLKIEKIQPCSPRQK